MRSSPKRICGFISPEEATTSPHERLQRWPAMVVVPMSKAMPKLWSWKPGQIAVITWPRCTATVTCHSPARRVFCRLRSEEHTSELQSLMRISYAVFCLKKKNTTTHEDILQL